MPTGKVGQKRLTPIRRMMSPRRNDSNMMYSVTAMLASKMLREWSGPVRRACGPSTEDAAAINPHSPPRMPVWKSGACIGGPSSGPTSFIRPVSARIVESVAANAAYGPSCPNQLASTWMSPGFRRFSAARSTTGQSAASMSRPSIRMSQAEISSLSRAAAPASAASSTTLDLLKLRNANQALCPFGVSGAALRSGSPAGGSIFCTSAPKSANSRAQ